MQNIAHQLTFLRRDFMMPIRSGRSVWYESAQYGVVLRQGLPNFRHVLMTLCTTHIQAWSAQQLQQDLGFASDQARQLSEWSHGVDASPVAERPPPKTLSIQMTLTPIPLVMHPSMGRDIAVAGGKAGEFLHVLPLAVKLHKP